jgi:hypothetical protein
VKDWVGMIFLVLVVFWAVLDCPRIFTDAHGLDLGCSMQNRWVFDPIAFAWKSFGFWDDVIGIMGDVKGDAKDAKDKDLSERGKI